LIDIHCHILWGLDDGPADLDGSLDLGRAAVAAGTTMIVATPHIRDDYSFPIEAIDQRARELRTALADEGIDLQILPGGEVAIDKSADLTDAELAQVSLGRSPYLLVESPYGEATDFIERAIYDLQVRGFSLILAHPERSPSFQSDLGRLATLVERGVYTSITAASMARQFGGRVQQASAAMLAAGLVYNVASDAHDASRRGPALLKGFEALEGELPGVAAAAPWFVNDVPMAMLMRENLPEPPRLERPRRGLRRRSGR
jgi:protein-tyrosine phosphatase